MLLFNDLLFPIFPLFNSSRYTVCRAQQKLDLSSEKPPSPESDIPVSVEPLIEFANLISTADTVLQMVHLYYRDEIVC
jgi:hypothetical protein